MTGVVVYVHTVPGDAGYQDGVPFMEEHYCLQSAGIVSAEGCAHTRRETPLLNCYTTLPYLFIKTYNFQAAPLLSVRALPCIRDAFPSSPPSRDVCVRGHCARGTRLS